MNGAATSAVSSAAEALRAAATVERVGDRTARRIGEAHAIVGEDMAWVEAELARAASVGLSPGTLAAAHLLEAGGKRVRPLTVLLSAACFGEITPAVRSLAVVAELLHAATLLHDDVIDDADERRGRPASRRVWGNAVSVLGGDLLLTHALERTIDAAPALVPSLVATLRRLVDGEIVQLRGRTHLDLTEATYFAVVRDKTASLFAWAARAGAQTAGASPEAREALVAYGTHLGVAFQLVDDALDYAGDRTATGKALFGDLREGKVTLPLVRAIAARPACAPDVERTRAGDDAAARRLLGAVLESGACEEVRALAKRETDKALEALAQVDPSAARDLLAAVASELASRVA
jgi:octaprenyl-diphosphate synthase